MKSTKLCIMTIMLACSVLFFLPLVASADAGPDNTTFDQQVNPAQVTALYQTAYDQMKAGQYRDAISAFKQVISHDKNHAMAYTNMAYSYRQLGKHKKAIKLYHNALAIAPNLPEAHEYLGGALLELGRIDEAKKHLAILEKLDPRLAKELRNDIARHERS